MKKQNEYTGQMRLSALNLLGELPNFCALLFSAIATGAVLVVVDLIDTASNVLRNILVVIISWRLKKDLRYKYNYGIGKIEAMSSLLCDFVMVISLTVIMGFAVRDIINPRPVEDFVLFAILVKFVNIAADVYMYIKQKKLCAKSDSLVLKSVLSVAIKNMIFDITSFTALILIGLFGNIRLFWYISPVVSLVLGGYLLFTTARRLGESFGIMLDKSADEETQLYILQALTTLYGKYDAFENVRSRISGGTVFVDLDLGFAPELTYSEMKKIADDFETELSKNIPKCEVSICINGTKDFEKNPNK